MAVLGTHSVDQAALELRDLLSLLSAGIKRVYNHHPARERAVFQRCTLIHLPSALVKSVGMLRCSLASTVSAQHKVRPGFQP